MIAAWLQTVAVVVVTIIALGWCLVAMTVLLLARWVVQAAAIVTRRRIRRACLAAEQNRE